VLLMMGIDISDVLLATIDDICECRDGLVVLICFLIFLFHIYKI